MFASACDGGNGGYDRTGGTGGNDNLNKLRARQKLSCPNYNGENEGINIPSIPQIFQSGESALEMLGAATKTKSPRCHIPPYVYNICCDGLLGPIYAEGPPRVFTSIDGCYLSMIFTFLLLLLLLLQYLGQYRVVWLMNFCQAYPIAYVPLNTTPVVQTGMWVPLLCFCDFIYTNKNWWLVSQYWGKHSGVLCSDLPAWATITH